MESSYGLLGLAVLLSVCILGNHAVPLLQQTVPPGNVPVCPLDTIEFTCSGDTEIQLRDLGIPGAVIFDMNSMVNDMFTTGPFKVVLTSINSSTLTSTATIDSVSLGDHGRMISCRDDTGSGNQQVNTVQVEAAPGPPTLIDIPQLTCDNMSNSSNITLEWTDTGGQGVMIEYYLVDVTGFTCPPDQCNVTTNTTTITGLQCDTSYTVTVRAVNCGGEGNSSDPIKFIIQFPTMTTSSTVSSTVSTPSSSPDNTIPSPSTSLTPPPPPPAPEDPDIEIGPIAGGAGGGAVVIIGLSFLIGFILGCVCCPCCTCLLICRRKCCPCCPEKWIFYGPYCEGDNMPTPHVEKQPVLKSYSKEKEMETGQPSYPELSGPTYQDPNTIQRQAAPSGELYAQPDKPARHQKQAATELPTYQDPATIQRQAAPTTGDMYALPEKQPKQPSGPAPMYTAVDKSNQSRGMYADLDLDLPGAATGRRPAPTPDTTYSQVEHRM